MFHNELGINERGRYGQEAWHPWVGYDRRLMHGIGLHSADIFTPLQWSTKIP